MELNDSNQIPDDRSSGAMQTPLLTDKEEVIKVLNDLVANYPLDEIPFEVFEQALSKFTQPRDIGRLKDHPAINKLDQVLAQHKTIRTA